MSDLMRCATSTTVAGRCETAVVPVWPTPVAALGGTGAGRGRRHRGHSPCRRTRRPGCQRLGNTRACRGRSYQVEQPVEHGGTVPVDVTHDDGRTHLTGGHFAGVPPGGETARWYLQGSVSP